MACIAQVACLVFALGAGCGGESTPAAESAHEAAQKRSTGKARASSDDSESDGDAAKDESAESPARSACDDGACFTCGKGSCPLGWYCDESAQGGAACSWLPACGKKPDCACVSKVLGSACSCAEEGGGPHTKCK
jgi:hypothetical protein